MYSSRLKSQASHPSQANAEGTGNGLALPAVNTLQARAAQQKDVPVVPAVVQRQKFDDLNTPIGVFTGDSGRNDKVVSYDSEDDEVEEGRLVAPEEAQQVFKGIQQKLQALGWSLLKSEEREHCYTEVIRHYWEPADNEEEGKAYDIPSYARGVGIGHIPEKDIEKIVYYSPQCPLLDLIHEMDHVDQQEMVFKTTGTYLFTNWDAVNWEKKEFGQMSGSVGSAFYSDENREFNQLIRQKLGFVELSDGQNEYAEYHNYLLEYLRYADMQAPEEEKLSIKKKVDEHRDKAKGFAKDNEEDVFIKACEAIKSMAELEREYAAALDS